MPGQERTEIVKFEVAEDELADGVPVLAVTGELDLATAEELQAPLLGLTRRDGVRGIVVDLSDCSFIDSQGIAVLLAGYRALKADDGSTPGPHLAIVVSSEAITRTLKLTGLDRWIPLCEDRDAARRALASAGG
jgi:anti-anti-sigma factor